MRKIKRYEVTYDSDVYAISLVEEPAIEETFVYLHAEKPHQICLEKEDKHLIVGAVLIPDKPIYRNQGGEEFYIQFSKETIEKLAYEYLMNGRMYSTTTDHQDIADDVVVVESWIKASQNDKSLDYGMDLPIGTWLVAMKCNNEEVWQRVKDGELRGFSIESFVSLEEIKSQINMRKTNLEAVEINETFWDKLKAIIADALGKAEDAPEVEEAVATVEEEVTPIEETPAEEEVEMAEEAPIEEEPVAEAEAEQIAEEVVEIVETTNTEEADKIAELEEIINKLEEEVNAKMDEIEALKKENQKLSKQPSAEPIKIEASKNENGYSFLDFASGKMKLK